MLQTETRRYFSACFVLFWVDFFVKNSKIITLKPGATSSGALRSWRTCLTPALRRQSPTRIRWSSGNKPVLIRANTCISVQIRTSTCKSALTRANTCKSLQTLANPCKHLHIRANTCISVQTSASRANTCISVQTLAYPLAYPCKHLQIRANPC
jgi:hypothetical protein